MSQIKVLGLASVLSFLAGSVYAQDATFQAGETVQSALENLQTSSNLSGFEETYGEQIAREQAAAQAAEQESKENQNSVLATVPQDSTIDYKGIANAFFAKDQPQKADETQADVQKAQPKTYEDVLFTITDPTSHATLGMGHTIDLKLRTSSNLKWNFDKELKTLEFLSERTEDGFFHAVFKAKAPGQETLYFDCLDVGNPENIKVLETKLMIVTVE